MKRKDRKPVSIKWKIFTSLLFFIVIIIMVLWLLQVFFLEKFYVHIKSNSVKEAASEVNEVITKRFANEIDETTYKEKISTIAQENDFCVIVYDKDSIADPLQSYTSDPKCQAGQFNYEKKQTLIQELKECAQKNGGIASKLIEDTGKKDKLPGFESFQFSLGEITTPPSPNSLLEDENKKERMKAIAKSIQNMTYISVVTGNEDQMKTSVISAQLTPVNATIETIQTQFVMIAAILIVIAMLLALYLSKKIAKPIISINSGAKTLAKGEYDVTFQGRGYLEIEELSNTLNYAAKELSKVENLRRELIANMSHDLRTPLTMISGYGEVMRDIPGENTPENVQIIIDETNRLTNLVNDMLDLSKLQAGVQELNATEMNITQEIRNILQRYEKLLREAEYDLEFCYDEEVYIQGDIIKLDQVIYNLINNAINYCGEDHKVIIQQSVKNEEVLIEISDHGPGIEQDQLPYIWERYYKVDKTHVRSKVGSGLGLSIVKAVLELHKARYGVRSEVGKGTTFWFALPILKG